jgi:alpha-methylacyl-CoA racemase
MAKRGPLAGLRVIEMVGLGPGPFAGMLLADMGAEVLRVDRTSEARPPEGTGPATNPMNRGKRSVSIDLKRADGVDLLLRLVESADAFFEVFRPGVAERLGFGPEPCLHRNPRLVYGRLTGWGQDGPLAPRAGHDIDYIAVAGALEPIGRQGQPPTPPVNVLGDFAGGGMLIAYGIVCAVLEAGRSGQGQVVDAAMVDGAALLMTPFFAARSSGTWGERGTNFLDTGAHFYEVYECADGGYVAVGAVEPQFYGELLDKLGLGDEDPGEQWDKAKWQTKKQRLAERFRTKSRDEWCRLFEGSDACVAPVLSPLEAPGHPHSRARDAFLAPDGVPQPAPAPRFSRTPAGVPDRPTHPGPDTDAALAAWGIPPADVEAMRRSGTVA